MRVECRLNVMPVSCLLACFLTVDCGGDDRCVNSYCLRMFVSGEYLGSGRCDHFPAPVASTKWLLNGCRFGTAAAAMVAIGRRRLIGLKMLDVFPTKFK